MQKKLNYCIRTGIGLLIDREVHMSMFSESKQPCARVMMFAQEEARRAVEYVMGLIVSN